MKQPSSKTKLGDVKESQWEPEITELEYVEQLLEDFDLSPNDRIGDLLEALEEDEAEEVESR